MSFRFQADADLNPEIGRGLIASEAGRVLVTRDVSTMPDHFERFVADR